MNAIHRAREKSASNKSGRGKKNVEMKLLFIHLGINAGFWLFSLACWPEPESSCRSRCCSPCSNEAEIRLEHTQFSMNDIDAEAFSLTEKWNTPQKGRQCASKPQQERIDADSDKTAVQSWERERTKSIISRKFKWELPLIAEFKIHTESRFNRKSTPHFIGFLELTLKHKQAMLSSDNKKRAANRASNYPVRAESGKNKCRIRLLLLLLSCLCYAVLFFVCSARIKHNTKNLIEERWNFLIENFYPLALSPCTTHVLYQINPGPFACRPILGSMQRQESCKVWWINLDQWDKLPRPRETSGCLV